MEAQNLDDIIVQLHQATGKEQIAQNCLAFCNLTGFDDYLLYGSIFTSLISPPDYIITGPGKGAKIKKARLEEIIRNGLHSSTPLITGNIDKTAQSYNILFRTCQPTTSRKLSISFPVHFPLGKFALLHLSAKTDKQESADKIMSTLATGNLFAREAGISIINELESELENKPPYLSQREKECLLLATDGASPKAISEQVGLSAHTVIFYLKKAREKLHTKNIQGAIGRAMLSGDIGTQIGSEKV